MSTANVRPAALGDIAAITRIYADAVEHGTATFEIEAPDEAEMAHRQHKLLANGYPYFVVEHAGAVAGYAYAGPYHRRAAYRWTVEDTVFVDPQFHRAGLGRLLMTQLIAAAEQGGFRQMIALIGDSTNAGSIGLHEAVSFRRIGILQSVGFKHGRWLDVVVMQRRLGGADSTPP
jgi:L-amino acid N-acyltransferase YncA